ncbi:MAG: type II toxin-antitoxin system RelE/ParE family toxin [Spirochaetales bacterium]|nr:type II toxin-antitoxin system RelE/ParE family toxin [Spirochaetales bacterium]
MTVEFINKDLQELYETGTSRKYRNVPKNITDKMIDAVIRLQSSPSIGDIWKQRSLRFERLQGTERYSVRLNIVWRLEMIIEWTDNNCSVGIIGITELSRHYGD